MKSRLTVLIGFLLISTYSAAQITFEKGYFIDNQNRRTECLIKNLDWKNNPTDFLYKINESDSPEKATIETVKEFGIYDFSKYVRADVKIDRSSDRINELTQDKNPVWSEERVFLKVLLEGKATLYSFDDGKVLRFFYSVNDTAINQLIYKEYLMGKNVASNNKFREQLYVDVRCEKIKTSTIENLTYYRNHLEKYFRTYNSCFEETATEFSKTQKRNYLNLKIVPGANISSFSIFNVEHEKDFYFNTTLDFRLGLEAEFILSFNKNKWGIVGEPTFQYYKGKSEFRGQEIAIDYKGVDFPLGVRYYSFIKPDLKLFFDGFFINSYSINFDSQLIFEFNRDLKVETRNSLALGGGVNYKKMGLELRYYFNRDLISNTTNWLPNYQRISILFAYRFLTLR